MSISRAKSLWSSIQSNETRPAASGPSAATYPRTSLFARFQKRSIRMMTPANPASMNSGASSPHSKFRLSLMGWTSASVWPRPRCGFDTSAFAHAWRARPSIPQDERTGGSRAYPRELADGVVDAVDERRRPYAHEDDKDDQEYGRRLLADAHLLQAFPLLVEGPEVRLRQHAKDVRRGDSRREDAQSAGPPVICAEDADEDMELRHKAGKPGQANR